MNGKHEYARSAVLISAFKIRLLDSMTWTAKMKANISQEATTHSTKLKHAQWMLIHFLKQSWQCKGYTHHQQVVKYWKLNSTLNILTTSWNYVSLTTRHKKPYRMSEINKLHRKKHSSRRLRHQTGWYWPLTNTGLPATQTSTSGLVLICWMLTEPADIAVIHDASHGAWNRLHSLCGKKHKL